MTFEALEVYQPLAPAIWLTMAAIVIFMIAGIIMANAGLSKRYFLPSFLVAFGFFGYYIYAGIVDTNHFTAVQEHNVKIATENIAKKYDVKSVDWEAKDTHVSPSSVKADNLLVEAPDGRSYIFKYRVDPVTSEPILKAMPINGGEAPKEALTADSLLKNKG